jgi:hypothetical protein
VLYLQLRQSSGVEMNNANTIPSEEYSSAFPAETEHQAWAESLELDAKLVTTNQVRILDEDLSPFNTVNS